MLRPVFEALSPHQVERIKEILVPIDLSETLVVGISATALFDLSEADKVFRSKLKEDPDTAIEEYRAYMLEHESEELEDGTGMPLVKALLNLNKHQKDGEPPIVEVVVMSRNSPENRLSCAKRNSETRTEYI